MRTNGKGTFFTPPSTGLSGILFLSKPIIPEEAEYEKNINTISLLSILTAFFPLIKHVRPQTL